MTCKENGFLCGVSICGCFVRAFLSCVVGWGKGGGMCMLMLIIVHVILPGVIDECTHACTHTGMIILSHCPFLDLVNSLGKHETRHRTTS